MGPSGSKRRVEEFGMVFWKTYPIYRIIESLYHHKVFLPQLVEKEPLASPTESPMERVKQDATEVRAFLRQYFGNPPHTPYLDIPEHLLCGPSDHVFVVRDKENRIVGSIRYHYLGGFLTSEDEPMYIVDCFCIHPDWRRQGLGDYLLTELNRYVNHNDIPYSLFLKEGKPVSRIAPAYYTGMYVYRELTSKKASMYLMDLTTSEAHRLMDTYRSFPTPRVMVRKKAVEQCATEKWKWYRKKGQSVLICVQDTYQRLMKDGRVKKLGWCTAWLESPCLTDEFRGEAACALADDIFPQFDYLWMNRAWVGDSEWTVDGPFHWYTYQWTSSVKMDHSYAIIS
jgi:GNAT superfamily N-acetyltransferase